MARFVGFLATMVASSCVARFCRTLKPLGGVGYARAEIKKFETVISGRKSGDLRDVRVPPDDTFARSRSGVVMSFSPAFALLAKLSGTSELPDLTGEDMVEIATYLGVAVGATDSEDTERRLESDLNDQNRFLTAHLFDSDIAQSSEYKKSAFIREVVANNRKNKN